MTRQNQISIRIAFKNADAIPEIFHFPYASMIILEKREKIHASASIPATLESVVEIIGMHHKRCQIATFQDPGIYHVPTKTTAKSSFLTTQKIFHLHLKSEKKS